MCQGSALYILSLIFVYVSFSHQLNNPDMRVVIIKDFVRSNFPATPLKRLPPPRCVYVYVHENISEPQVHNSLVCEQPPGLDVNQSLIARVEMCVIT